MEIKENIKNSFNETTYIKYQYQNITNHYSSKFSSFNIFSKNQLNIKKEPNLHENNRPL